MQVFPCPQGRPVPISMYRLSVPVFIRGLGILRDYLDQAERFEKENSLAPDTLATARLAPDMLPLAGQVQRASDTSKNAIGRLTDVVPPRFADDETTLEELRHRIDATVVFFEGIDADALAGAERKQVSLNFGKVKPTFDGMEYLLTFVLPNFYFHLATAHDILRSKGVMVGKADYLGSFAQYE